MRLRYWGKSHDATSPVLLRAWNFRPFSARQRAQLTRKVPIPLNNADLAEAVATEHNLAKADARKLVDAVFASIAEAAAKGDEISLNGFGKFKVKSTPARDGRNPSTGATIQIAASKKLTFAPAKAVKDKLNG